MNKAKSALIILLLILMIVILFFFKEYMTESNDGFTAQQDILKVESFDNETQSENNSMLVEQFEDERLKFSYPDKWNVVVYEDDYGSCDYVSVAPITCYLVFNEFKDFYLSIIFNSDKPVGSGLVSEQMISNHKIIISEDKKYFRPTYFDYANPINNIPTMNLFFINTETIELNQTYRFWDELTSESMHLSYRINPTYASIYNNSLKKDDLDLLDQIVETMIIK